VAAAAARPASERIRDRGVWRAAGSGGGHAVHELGYQRRDRPAARAQRAPEEGTAELDKQITEILGLEAQKQRMRSRMDIVERLQRSRPEVVHVFDQLVRTLPDGVYLTSVKQTDKKLELKGVAQSSTRVSTFMRNIESSPWLTDPQLQVVETVKQGGVGSEFTLFATQKSTEPAEEERKPRRGARPAGAAGT
jgi:type IV pilus assembly protein PilN